MAQAADVLDGSTPFHPVPAEVPHMLARDLRDAAQQLCEHARVSGIRCRYCRAIVETGAYPSECEAAPAEPHESYPRPMTELEYHELQERMGPPWEEHS